MLSPSTRIGPYEIVSPLGAGGMGEVYRARDSRLGREVALKILPGELSGDDARQARFEQEARAAGALNHPNIVSVFDVGKENGHAYIVCELVDGEPLRELISRGPAPVRKLIDIGAQIADGLAAAHAAGIVHRDLKPENIMLTRDGRVKILDFGLAKLAAPGPDGVTLTMAAHTIPGTVLGTIAYMSPEQARGLELDYRSDQFSFGLILHEMATGEQTFRRGSQPETMTAIIRDEAPALGGALPAPLRWIVDRLLAKEPEERYASTKDLYRDLRTVREHLSDASSLVVVTPFAPAPRRKLLRRLALVSTGLITGAALALLVLPSAEPDLSSYRFTPISREEATEWTPIWSPDGKSIAYTATIRGVNQVFTRTLGAPQGVQLTRSDRSCFLAFWSPNGSTVYYWLDKDLWAVGVSGGEPRLVLRDSAAGSMHPDGQTIVYTRDGKMWACSLQIGQPQEYRRDAFPANTRFSYVRFSPDGSKLAALATTRGAIEKRDLWILPYPSGAPRKVPGFEGGSYNWFPDNQRLVFGLSAPDSSSLLELDTASGRRRTILRTAEYLSSPAVSPDGKRIAYHAGHVQWDILEVSLPGGIVHPMLARGGVSWYPDWAPSGTHFLFVNHDEIEDRSPRESFSRRLVSPATDGLPPGVKPFANPRFAPDGERFAFVGHSRTFSPSIWLSTIGGGRAVALDPAADRSREPSWSPDGQWIAYLRAKDDLWNLAKIRPGAASQPVILHDLKTAPAFNRMTAWSPSGEWILYPEADGLFVISPDSKSRRKLTSRQFGVYGFSKDGGLVFGVWQNAKPDGAERQLFSVDVKTGAEKLLGPLDIPPSAVAMAGFSLHPDGKRFATSVSKWPYDIWMLEGFDEKKSWLDRLRGR